MERQRFELEEHLERLLGARRYAEFVEQTTLIARVGMPAVEMAERFQEATRKLRAAAAPCPLAQQRARDALKRLGARVMGRGVASGDVLQVGDHGPIFKLRSPHTVDSIRADAGRASEHKPLLCRVKHSWRKVGDTYLDAGDPVGSTLSLIWMRIEDALVRCRRCGAIRTRSVL